MLPKEGIFFYGCLFFIVGIIIGNFFYIPFFYLYLIVLFSFLLIILTKNNLRIYFIFLACLFFGWGYFIFNLPNFNDQNKIYYYHDQKLIFYGEVIRADNKISGQEIIIKANKNKDNQNKISGLVMLNVSDYPVYLPGDCLQIETFLKKYSNSSNSGFSNYLFKENIFVIGSYPKIIKITEKNNWRRTLFLLRTKFKGFINRSATEPASSLLLGMLLGDKKNISPSIKGSFSDLGLSHIIAISGTHLAILMGVLIGILYFFRLSRYQSFIPASILIVFYVFLVGAPASAVRSSVMVILAMSASQFSRLSKSFNALIFASTLMSLLNPKVILFDVGFQFSFMAVLGLIYFSPIFKVLLKKIKTDSLMVELLIASLSAQITVYPLIVYYFGNFSLISLIANLLILPSVPILMIAGLILIFFSFFNYSISGLVGNFIEFIISYWLLISEILLKFPLSVLKIENFDLKWLFLSYFLIFIFYWQLKKKVYF